MAKPLNIDVIESVKELRALQKKEPSRYKRIQMLILIKDDRNKGKLKLAAEVGVSVKTIQKWRQDYIECGLSKLLADDRGASGIITGNIHDKLVHFITAIPDKQKHRRAESVEAWLHDNFNITMKRGALLRYLHRHFGKSQKRKVPKYWLQNKK